VSAAAADFTLACIAIEASAVVVLQKKGSATPENALLGEAGVARASQAAAALSALSHLPPHAANAQIS
jgi:hypothetical protein